MVLSVFRVYALDIDPVLCDLILCDWHHSHENIASILRGQLDSTKGDSLFLAAQRKYAYLDYDDTYQFARKCIKALSAIGDNNAVNKLRSLSNNGNEFIEQYAIKELTYMGHFEKK